MKATKIIKIVTFVFIGTGVLFLLYSNITNIISGAKEIGILSRWEEQKGTSLEEEVTSEEVIGKDGEESNIILDEPESLSDNTEKEIINYDNLTAEDFLPLKIIIPKIDLEWIVNEGSDRQTLKEGPGHIIETPLPGDVGRCTISGHRTTYGAPFNKIDDLVEGDLIYLETIKGQIFTYVMTELEIVYPKDVYILEGTEKRELLLTSCYPEYSAAERIILISELISIYPLGLEF